MKQPTATSDSKTQSTGTLEFRRAMVRADLMGGHTHQTLEGVKVHVWRRRGKYLARGRYEGHPYGETLGAEERTAVARLRQLLTEIENGSYVRPSEARRAPLRRGRVPQLTLRELCNHFLSEKRKTLGKSSASTYASRLAPVLDFLELPTSRKEWPLAASIDRPLVIALRKHLHQVQTTRNGRAGAPQKPLSARQIINILECLRTALAWAHRADVRLLPVDWVNPLTLDLVGDAPLKDPWREDPLPLKQRILLVEHMDLWQLLHLSLSLVFPLRSEEAVGLLVSEVSLENSWLVFGTRFNGNDFTKGHTSFKLPFPAELVPVLQACIGGRSEGPLLRKPMLFNGRRQYPMVSSAAEIQLLTDRRLRESALDDIACANDRKDVFRSVLSDLGGVSTDQLAASFKCLVRQIGLERVTLKTLRSAATTSMEAARMSHLAMRYLTSHSTNDILNVYAILDIRSEMRRYFRVIQPLLEAIVRQSQRVGISPATQ